MTGLKLKSMPFGVFVQNDGLGSQWDWSQEMIFLQAFACKKHRAEGHTANMGFSPERLEGSSASCSPWLPAAVHSARANDGWWQNSLGNRPPCSYRHQLEKKGKLNYKMLENAVRTRKSQILFSVHCCWWNLCVYPNRCLTLSPFGRNSSVTIKIYYTHQCSAWKCGKSRSMYFPYKGILTFSLAFLLVSASIHSFSFSSMSIKAQRTPSINSFICKKIPSDTDQIQKVLVKVSRPNIACMKTNLILKYGLKDSFALISMC